MASLVSRQAYGKSVPAFRQPNDLLSATGGVRTRPHNNRIGQSRDLIRLNY